MLNWKTEKRKISELIPTEYNPRQLTEKQVKDLKASIEKFNLVEIPVMNLDNTILAGHQRLKILSLLGRGAEEIDVRVPDRQLTKQEADEYLIRSNKNTGGWDWDLLANGFDAEDLVDWGFEKDELMLDTDLGDEFSLPDGEKGFQQMTFTLANEQAKEIKEALKEAEDLDGETFGNENRNGNAIYLIVKEWILNRSK